MKTPYGKTSPVIFSKPNISNIPQSRRTNTKLCARIDVPFKVPTNKNVQSINFFPLFQVSVPQASRVAVVVGGEWTHLEQNASGVWEGAAFFQAGWGKEDTAALTANYGSDSASYNTLLEFRM